MNPEFQYLQHAWLFAAILLFAGLFFLRAQWRKKVLRRIGDIQLVRLLTAGFSRPRFILKFSLVCLAFVTGVIAVMNLRRPGAADGLSRKGIDVVIALDVSRSMMATDMPPNRLERAKELINRLMNSMPDDRFALIVFAGKAYLQMPLTNDHGAAAMFVSAAGPDAVAEQGTIISEALRRTATVFNGNERRFKSVILISDGEDHDPEAVKTATELAEQGMMISTVGIGSPEGSYITDPATGENKKDETGSQVISKLNEEELQAIASATRGTYVRLDDSAEAVAKLEQQLSQIESIALDDVSLVNFKTYYWVFAGLMLLLLVAEFFIPETRKLRKEAPRADWRTKDPATAKKQGLKAGNKTLAGSREAQTPKEIA